MLSIEERTEVIGRLEKRFDFLEKFCYNIENGDIRRTYNG